MSNSASKYRLSVSLSETSQLSLLDMEKFDLIFLGDPFCRQTLNNPLENLYTLEKALEALKSQQEKVVVSLPLCPTNKELVYIERVLQFLTKNQVMGVEVHSAGMALKVSTHYPELKIYFGNFANVYTDHCARLLEELRVIGGTLPYELNIDEIEYIHKHSQIEIWLPIFGNFPIAFSQYCYFHPEQIEFPFTCGQTCEEGTIVDYGEGRMAIHRGRAIFSHKCLNMLKHLPMLIQKGFTDFRISGLLFDVETLNSIAKVFRKRLDEIFATTGEEGKSQVERDLKEDMSILEKFAPYGFCNGFYFTRRGMDYVDAIIDIRL